MLRIPCFAAKQITLLLLCIPPVAALKAQYKLTVIVDRLPSGTNADSIYLAGTCNRWNPGEAQYRFTNNNATSIEIAGLPAGNFEFKLTGGDWTKVETNKDGTDIKNRNLDIAGDTTIHVSIAGWKSATTPKISTASTNVKLIDTAFVIPQLNTKRRVWIYLPPNYNKTKKRYPVIYMQDGQNVFDELTSAFGEWNVDETLDSLIGEGKPACIVVAIDNGPERMLEYNPYDTEKFGKGKGDEYINFIAKTLKPYIDKHYRTNSVKAATSIAGSSMGGLIAYYAILKYPEVFGNAGIFSPSFWIAPQIKELTASACKQVSGKVFFYIGGLEGDQHIDNMKEVTMILGENASALIYEMVDPEGQHNEAYWGKWFAEFYDFITTDAYNNVLDVEE